ncbi:M48 family metallopeptidase [Paraburkholderia sp. BR10954]|uniref:M48 family metallopeptidase n=1 Tax=Paraburkholderia sp. BR10954 TaxID=3236995 RepID=UPI0034D321DD
MTLGETRSVEASGQTVKFQLKRSERRTLSISVEPDRRVVVTAPVNASAELIDLKVLRRVLWIRQQQRYFEALPPPIPVRRWLNGETHRYLGRQYRLKVCTAPKVSVRLVGRFFVVEVPDLGDARSVEKAMLDWYRAHARAELQERMRRLLESSTWLRLRAPPQLTVRRMRLRWGSTTSSGRIFLNTELVKLPLGCIDYVIAHELAHLKVPNHGRLFWRLLGRLYPEWKTWREKLSLQEV